MSGDNLDNVRHEASRHLRNKKREYLKGKINELTMNHKKTSTSETSIEDYMNLRLPT
jgi:hypothetical protein